MRLLIAEDTVDLNRVVTAMLTHSGYEVDSVLDGQAAIEKVRENSYDAVILDIMMPRKDGLSVLKDMRTENIRVPVLMLTAKSEVDDRVAGLEAGADDYLSKPFAMKELLARIKAMTRRREVYNSEKLQYLDLTLEANTLELSAENSIRLSLKEFELMQLFIVHAGKLLEEEFILSHVWNKEPDATSDTVYLYVNYLRRKLSGIVSQVTISGERGKGYLLR